MSTLALTPPSLPQPDFARRSTLPELMDDLAADPAVTRQSLRELELINRLLGGFALSLEALDTLRLEAAHAPVRIVDVGCGSGDMLRRMAHWARRRGIPVDLVGVDWNPVMIAVAQEASVAYPEVRYVLADVWSDELTQLGADVVHSSLFCHHFDAPELPRLMRHFAASARRAVVVNDLHRHWFAYYSIILLTRLFSRSTQVKYDGPVSVLRAMTRADWVEALAAAGLSGYQLRWRWAFRWQLIVPTR